jgi:predicted membrane protein
MLRAVSLIFAALSSVIGLVFPYALALHPTALNQSIILVMMAATSGAFIYGVGFQIQTRWLNDLIRPTITWPVLAVAAGSLLVLR